MSTTSIWTFDTDGMQDNAASVMNLTINTLVNEGIITESVAEEFKDSHNVVIAKTTNGFTRWLQRFFGEKFTTDKEIYVCVKLPVIKTE